MQFLDCNLSYGPEALGAQVKSCTNIAALKAHLIRAGIAGGLVSKACSEVGYSNASLAEDLRDETGLWGVWRLLPSSAGEIPPPQSMPNAMKAQGIAALTICPESNRFMPSKLAMGDYYEMACERKIPLLLNTSRGLTLEQAAELLRDFPAMTCILTYANCWPSDRRLRPFLDTYENLYLDMSYILTDSWLKDFRMKYPASRLLFGSAFPESYLGAHMMVIRHAEIAEEDKRLIAGENLMRLLREARYD